jgi:tRNA G46 methylase TrmB
MAKHAPKTNALGMELSPSCFKTVEKEQVAPVEAPADILANMATKKPVIKGYSVTLHEDNMKKLKAIASSRGVSASKIIDHLIAEFLKEAGL